MRRDVPFQDEGVPPETRQGVNLPVVLLLCLIALATFTATLECRGWVYRVNGRAQTLKLNTLRAPSLEASALEREVEALRSLRADLQDWRKAKISWAGPLKEVAGQFPGKMRLTRVGVQSTLGGSFIKPDPLLSARFVPQRDYRLQIEGSGRDAEVSGHVSDFVLKLTRSGQASNIFSKLELQGIVAKPTQEGIIREFSLLAKGSAGGAK